MKILLVVLLLSVVYVKEAAQKPTEETLKVSVYYESMGYWSIIFITEQLYPAYQKIGSSLEVDLVPYGNTRKFKINDKWAYRCVYGAVECYTNVFQACGLARISNQTEQLQFVNCILDTVDSGSFLALKSCAHSVGLDIKELFDCTKGSEGIELYGKLADKQESLDLPSDRSPWIVINGKFNKTLELQVLTNFLETACNLLDNKPPGCAKTVV